jgi:hypothetical protein
VNLKCQSKALRLRWVENAAYVASLVGKKGFTATGNKAAFRQVPACFDVYVYATPQHTKREIKGRRR